MNNLYLPSPNTSETFLRIVTVNDIYRINNYSRLQTAIKHLKSTTKNAVVVSTLCGDFISPNLISSVDGGKSIIDLISKLEIDYLCLGNHEFDLNVDTLITHFQGYKGKCLISNIPKMLPSAESFLNYDILTVGNRKVVFGGFCTDRKDIFRPGLDIEFEPIFESLKKIWELASNKKVNVLIPLTHQSLQEDHDLIVDIAEDSQLNNHVPVILGGHEHEIYLENHHQTMLIKAGIDAEHVAVIDIWWDKNGKIKKRVQLLSTDSFRKDPDIERQSLKITTTLNNLDAVELFRMPEDMSSQRVRFQEEKIPTLFCDFIKKSFHGIEAAILNGGCIRGNRKYTVGMPFTFRNLVHEIPFEVEMALVDLPGKVLQKAVAETRSYSGAEDNHFLHMDSQTLISQDIKSTIITINDRPFDPERTYKVAINQHLLAGLDNISSLKNYFESRVPSIEQCIPAKNIIVELCIKQFWRKLIDLSSWDYDNNSQLSKAEILLGLKKTFSLLDENKDGYINKKELNNFLLKETGYSHSNLLDIMIKVLDKDGDGKVSLSELSKLAI